ncbi:MAG: endonuclease/exonuclease/phosphatase family protein [Clostridia bacterium]|nr:endonuclease/exonuclease/phosphatase family protein [Clostridia bacterium]
MKKILLSVAAVFLAVLLVAVGYVVYVLIAYYRIGDKNLTIEQKTEASAPVGEELSFVTFNFGFGAYSRNFSFFMDGGKYSRAYSAKEVKKNFEGASALIESVSPDILLVQEVDKKATRSHKVDETALFKQKFPSYSCVFAVNYDSPYLFYPFHSPHGKSLSGILTFSKFKITEAKRVSLPIETSLMKLVDLDRCYSVSRIPTSDGKELVLYNVHLSAYTSDGKIANKQLTLLVSDMTAEREKGNYVIAGGDFNKDLLGDSSEYFGVSGDKYTWAQPIPEGVIPEGLTVVAPSNLPTCRNTDKSYVNNPNCFVLTVDGFLVSDNVSVSSVSTLPMEFDYSDHNPVEMKIVLG